MKLKLCNKAAEPSGLIFELLEELIEAGNEGLRKAAIKYDASRGFKFIAYAVWWIRQSIIQALEENKQ